MPSGSGLPVRVKEPSSETKDIKQPVWEVRETGPNLQDLVLCRWSFGCAQGHGVIGHVVFGQKSARGRVCDSRLLGGLTGDFAGLTQFDNLLQLSVRDLKRKISKMQFILNKLTTTSILNYYYNYRKTHLSGSE